MSIARKLQIPNNQTIRLINAPAGFKIDAPTNPGAGSLLLFATDIKTLMRHGRPLFAAAKQDKLVWIAYPKAGKLGTDLNRDKLADAVRSFGIQPVRLVSLDDTWSAMRFRPA